MPAEVRVAAMRQKLTMTDKDKVINVCSNSAEAWQSGVSPFLLGPCTIPIDDFREYTSLTHENAWQYSKVYACHADDNGDPTEKYWDWAKEGWSNPKAVRFPMGRGKKPLYSLWRGAKYGYVEARKMIYGPLYRDAVLKTQSYSILKSIYESWEGTIYLRDFDGYDEVEKGVSLNDVVNNSKRKMGHAFVLKMLLTDSAALKLFRS